MNAVVSIDTILSPQLVAPPYEALTPAIVFAPGGVETIIAKVEAEVRATPRDITTAEGRKAVKSLAYKVARSKTALDEMGKDLVADIKAKAGAIDAERRTIRDRLDALQEEVRGPLTAWEDAEAARIDGHERALVWIVECTRFTAPPTAAEVKQRIGQLAHTLGRDWQEFAERASAAGCDAIPALDAMFTDAGKREADAAELAELRRMKAERDAKDEAEREAKWKAEREAHEVARLAEQAAQAAERERQRQEQAKRDQEAAVTAAIEAERVKGEREKAAAIQAEQRRHEEAARAAAAKKAAEDAAEQKRQANKRHRDKIQKEIRAALTACFPDHEPGHVDRIIEAISTGLIPHVSITY